MINYVRRRREIIRKKINCKDFSEYEREEADALLNRINETNAYIGC